MGVTLGQYLVVLVVVAVVAVVVVALVAALAGSVGSGGVGGNSMTSALRRGSALDNPLKSSNPLSPAPDSLTHLPESSEESG